VENEIFTRKQAAEYMKVCIATFAKLQKQIPHIKFGKNVRFYKSDIDAFLEQKRVNIKVC
jgi:excisionase family DNA binding protein